MPRLPRLYIKDALYFVSCRAEHNENIFCDQEDYQMFLELVKKYQQQYSIKIFAYVLMPDHLYLLMEMEKPQEGQEDKKEQEDKAVKYKPEKFQEISSFMHALNNNYTKYYNNRYDRKGHLFRERFKSTIIEKDKYLLKMTAYIHLEPQRLSLVNDAKDYPYSSYQLYLYQQAVEKKDILPFSPLYKEAYLAGFPLTIIEVLKLLEGKSYVEYANSLIKDEVDFIHKKLQRGGVLGSEEFVRQIKTEVEAYQKQGETEVLGVQEKPSFRIFVAVGGLLLFLIISSGGAYLFYISQVIKKPEIKVVTVKEKDKFEELKLSEWDIKLEPIGAGSQTADRLSFRDGKFVSANLNSLGFSASNYSATIESNGKLVWETMQTSSNGTASWRGEIEQGKMSGVLSLRQEGKTPQDFSFVSISYRIRK